MKIVCSANMPFVEAAFDTLGDVICKQGRDIGPDDVRDADILAVRSTTKVTRELLAGSRVRFVGTATIGTDHMDLDYLAAAGIDWCYSPGCNANSVAEYVTAALLHLANQHGFTLAGKTIGIVGVGNVGRRVLEKAQALGLKVLLNDPPREREQDDSADFHPIDVVLAQSDILTLHVPLTHDGPDATHHLVDAAFLKKLKPGAIFINAARGPVVETDALIATIRSGAISHAVIDTWEGEPAYRHDLLPLADIATPH
ncbi:MAG: 4-phosphoerythronate dehydrogenase, partial [Verrucomicrobia bacterium]|nr:4-phosphoerythronate dehydrogenase [Verrucomicrobiota bacterium]